MPTIDVEAYGFKYLFPYQRLVTENILHNEEVSAQKEESTTDATQKYDCRKNQIIILPTAAGKSLCFQLPAPLLRGVTVVIYPLLGLIADQQRRLQSLGITHGVVSGSVSRQERLKVLSAAANGRIRVILTNPETILLPAMREQLSGISCSHLVIDEAHCISEWGKSFRPTYRDLGLLTKEVRWNSVSAFTATASEPIIADIRHTLFHNDATHLIRGNPDRENIHYSVRTTLSSENAVIDGVTQNSLPAPLIIFCSTRGETMRYAQLLRHYTNRQDIYFYHAGLSTEEKSAIEARFLQSKKGILCATCAYGMGMDKGDIRAVLHTFLPATIESYLQEAGRGGRDGKQAWAYILCSPSTIRQALARTPDTPLLPYILNRTECRRAILLRTLGSAEPTCSGCDVCDGDGATAHNTRRAISRHKLKQHKGRRKDNGADTQHIWDEWQSGISKQDGAILRYLKRHQCILSIEELAWSMRFRQLGRFTAHHHAIRYLHHLEEEGLIKACKGMLQRARGRNYRVRTNTSP